MIRTLSRRGIYPAFALTLVGLCLFLVAYKDVNTLQWRQGHNFHDHDESPDWMEEAEEMFCRSRHSQQVAKEPIPSIVHFVFLAERDAQYETTFASYLAIKAAVLRMEPSEVKVHTYDLNTENEWWKELADHVMLVKVHRDDVVVPGDRSLDDLHLAHQSDIIRIGIILREGGIYLDHDVYPLRTFNPLLANSRDAIMAHEGVDRYGLCNAVIIARPDSDFMHIWQDSYESFDPDLWNVHSVMMPKTLQVENPDLICPLSPTVFYWPTYEEEHVRYMHEPIESADIDEMRANMTTFGGSMYRNQLAFHAWGAHDYLVELTPEKVRDEDTRFNILLRDVVKAPWPKKRTTWKTWYFWG